MDTTTERYGELLFSHAHEGEGERLDALARALDPLTFRQLDRFGPADDARCLDIGSGLGTVAAGLAAHCPRGRVVATDTDIRHFPPPAERRGWEVVRHDLAVDEFPEGSFDLIHARWVFSHQRGRDAALARVVRWLAPGGLLFLEDMSRFALDSSPHPLYRKVSRAMTESVRLRLGTDFAWARTFPQPLRALGLTDLGAEVTVSAVGAGPMGRFWRLTAEQLTRDLRDVHGISEGQLAEFAALVEHPDFSDLCLSHHAAWGRRPHP
ncbi:class I SAM-dependent methyltransferase [Streptomyces sp. 8L]|uniref:class I SAM-dependent methyltransferase n=1 Tax=Streptomyces sp. 8L TaxID=2877242 RepID=UPI001CD78437|nr:methyltransferase domain-containing protein [Streptomyces sp. 8L]